MKLQLGDKVRRRPGYHNRSEFNGKIGKVVWVESHSTAAGPTFRVSVEFDGGARLNGVFASEFDLVERGES